VNASFLTVQDFQPQITENEAENEAENEPKLTTFDDIDSLCSHISSLTNRLVILKKGFREEESAN